MLLEEIRDVEESRALYRPGSASEDRPYFAIPMIFHTRLEQYPYLGQFIKEPKQNNSF